MLELGGVVLRYRDQEDRHIAAPASPLNARTRTAPALAGRARIVFGFAVVIACVALAGILWLALR